MKHGKQGSLDINKASKIIMVTGGAGYIGSHVCLELSKAGYKVIALDNLSNSSWDGIRNINKIFGDNIIEVLGDVRDKKLLNEIFSCHDIEAVIHLAALKAVGESTKKPLEYFDNNCYGTIQTLQTMKEFDCKKIVFSSSATVYGDAKYLPIDEQHDVSPINPYGETKLASEILLKSIGNSDATWSISILRYFNPVGAHPSGIVGENPQGIPNNLFPHLTRCAVEKNRLFGIFGNDFDTTDGTGVRDYVHVVDLAQGHLRALEYIIYNVGVTTVNLGTGQGYSVLQVIKTFEQVTSNKINYEILERRPGDVDCSFADPSLARNLFGWSASYDLRAMCEDAWRWQLNLTKPLKSSMPEKD